MVQANNYGRMGNVLFQIACAIGYALRHDIEFSVQSKTTDNFWNPLYLQHLVNDKWVNGVGDIVIKEKEFCYQELPFEESWRDKQIILDGYWQTEKYFKDYKGEILYLFNLPYDKKDGYVSCHVRRGDYLHLRDKHPEVTKEWYEMAMELFDGCKFKFFSDDIAWCRSQFADREDCEFSTNTNEVDDLIEMACCEHNICSASTFAWWGMWLNRNENKKVIFPKLWFMEGFGGLNTDDIVPEWCIKL